MNFYNPIKLLKCIYLTIKGQWLLLNSKNLQAISNFQKALDSKQGNLAMKIDLLKNIGIAYWRDQKFELGKEYLQKAEELGIDQINKKRIRDSELYAYLGILYDHEALKLDTKENLKKAKEYYQLAIKQYKKWDYLTNIDYIAFRLVKIDEWHHRTNEEKNGL